MPMNKLTINLNVSAVRWSLLCRRHTHLRYRVMKWTFAFWMFAGQIGFPKCLIFFLEASPQQIFFHLAGKPNMISWTLYLMWKRLFFLSFFTEDALPETTLPVYPCLGPAVRNALTRVSTVAGKPTEDTWTCGQRWKKLSFTQKRSQRSSQLSENQKNRSVSLCLKITLNQWSLQTASGNRRIQVQVWFRETSFPTCLLYSLSVLMYHGRII